MFIDSPHHPVNRTTCTTPADRYAVPIHITPKGDIDVND